MATTTGSGPVVLLVEDDEILRNEMAIYLSGQGLDVFEAPDTTVARAHLAAGPVSAIVLDVNLPGEDGLSLCRALNAEKRSAPILMVSAMGEPIDRIVGLEIGADDYLVKPVHPRELLARIRALLRRAPAIADARRPSSFVFDGFRFDPAARQLRAPNGVMLLLTRAEVSILTELVEHPRAVVSREDLGKLIGADDPDGVSRAVDLHISRLRRKLQSQTQVEILKTQRGLGYLIDAEVEPQ